MLILEGRSGDVRHATSDGIVLRGPGGKRRRIDQDVRSQVENDAMIDNKSLKSIAVTTGKFSKRTATRQQHVRTLRYLAGIVRAFAGENQISMCIDETTIGDEPTMGLCPGDSAPQFCSCTCHPAVTHGRIRIRRVAGVRRPNCTNKLGNSRRPSIPSLDCWDRPWLQHHG